MIHVRRDTCPHFIFLALCYAFGTAGRRGQKQTTAFPFYFDSLVQLNSLHFIQINTGVYRNVNTWRIDCGSRGAGDSTASPMCVWLTSSPLWTQCRLSLWNTKALINPSVLIWIFSELCCIPLKYSKQSSWNNYYMDLCSPRGKQWKWLHTNEVSARQRQHRVIETTLA